MGAEEADEETRRVRSERTRPERRPAGLGRRAPRPSGYYARPKEGWKGRLIDATAWLNRALYHLPPGFWLRHYLDRGRDFSEVEVRLARGGPGLHGLRIAYVSDLHAGGFMTEADVCRIFERVAEAGPDMICLGGDLLDTSTRDCRLLGKGLALLDPPLGVFAVPGNHDYYADPGLRVWRRCLEEHGVGVLLNQGRRVDWQGESLWLAGVDDLSQGRPDLRAALRDAREEEPILLLAHHPDFFPEASHAGVDLTLSGHTHAGQITLFGSTFLRHSQLGYWQGLFEEDGAQLYVGRGAGTTALPLRFHAPAEVPLIRLATST